MQPSFFGLFFLVTCFARSVSSSVFYSSQQAHMILRQKRANSFLEEIKPGNLERECMEETCDYEEAKEIFKTKEATLKFWMQYTDGDQCVPNNCVNGTCIDQVGSYTCLCHPGFEGRHCDFPVFATNCSEDNGGCDHSCQESGNGTSRRCGCLPGYTLADDGRSCQPSVPFACGKIVVDRTPEKKITNPLTGLKPYVVGGEKGKKGHSPWQVLLINAQGKFHCGGVLIDNSWVLTAAHCLEKGSRYHVRLGEYERYKLEDTEVTVPVSEVISHPHYDSNIADNDIALMRLSRPVPYSRYILPACLPPKGLAERVLLLNGTRMVVSGWGREKEGSSKSSSALRFIDIPLAPLSQCAEVMSQSPTENMLCAGELGVKKDACEGDSGGPMVTRYKGTWFLVGLVSWGEGCGRTDKLGIYTKVSNYLDWVQQVQRAKGSSA
ncbi:vitamin K-dependent protein C [Lepisosteus oculatus]|uniref:vitamin K-dependent protein C n=1 Tax=Lepisosteus oculatus TaxID=7918 RepID=UPI0035F5245D